MKLLFIYNANSDKISVALDFVHKIVSPSTYNCDLCAITYGNFGIKKVWEDFIKGLPMETEFLHKDEFQKKYPGNTTSFPAVFKLEDSKWEPCISAKEMETMDLTALMKRIEAEVHLIK